MPNHCKNILEINGKAVELTRLVEFIKSESNVFDFAKIVPFPQGTQSLDSEFGFNWRFQNWGTKWNSNVLSLNLTNNDSLKISFETAWDPSIAVTEKLAGSFPSLEFTHRYEEQGMDFSGIVRFNNGKFVNFARGEFGAYPLTSFN